MNYATLGGMDPCNTVYFSGNDKRYITELYEDAIKDKFVDKAVCRSKEHIKVTFDSNSTKIFVTFNNDQYMIDDPKRDHWNHIVPGRVLPEVYKAVKYRQTEDKFNLKVMDAKRAESYAQQIGLGTYEHGNFILRNYYMKYPELCVIPSAFTETLVGMVTHIEHCGKFFFKPTEMPYVAILRKLNDQIKTCELSPIREDQIEENATVIVRYEDMLYRGRLVQYSTDEDELPMVYLVDIGAVVPIKVQDIFYANNATKRMEIFDTPPRVFECTLCDIQPSFIKCSKGKWIPEALELFERNVMQKICEIEVYSVVQDVASVHLSVDDVDINEVLVKEGFAQFAEENYMSKVTFYLKNSWKSGDWGKYRENFSKIRENTEH